MRTEKDFVDGIMLHDGVAYFNDWMCEFVGQSWEGVYNDLCVDDKDEDEIREEKDKYLEEFYDWCENNEIEGAEV